MSMVETAQTIGLEGGCDFAQCSEFAYPLYKQLSEGSYDVMSVMRIPGSVDEWRSEHRTARKRADRAARRGYAFTLVRPEERVDEIHAINMSTPERQGRPMSAGYQQKPRYGADPAYPCLRHCVRRYGVEHQDGTLVAYCWVYRCGELALISQILGHADFLKDEIMFALVAGIVEFESADPDGYLIYNRHDSGTPGLRWFKERIGFEAVLVRWQA